MTQPQRINERGRQMILDGEANFAEEHGRDNGDLISMCYYDPVVFGNPDFNVKRPQKKHSRGRSSKCRLSRAVYTGFMDCSCGKTIQCIDDRQYKMLIRLHFKKNPQCKKIWDEMVANNK